MEKFINVELKQYLDIYEEKATFHVIWFVAMNKVDNTMTIWMRSLDLYRYQYIFKVECQ